MKQSQVCPKCGSREIFGFTEGQRESGGNYVYTGFFSAANVTRYVCCNCGYTEEYVRVQDIPNIIKFYKR